MDSVQLIMNTKERRASVSFSCSHQQGLNVVCLMAGKILLVMEYMANGNLWDSLQQDSQDECRWFNRRACTYMLL